jgi:hypothetical protein
MFLYFDSFLHVRDQQNQEQVNVQGAVFTEFLTFYISVLTIGTVHFNFQKLHILPTKYS